MKSKAQTWKLPYNSPKYTLTITIKVIERVCFILTKVMSINEDRNIRLTGKEMDLLRS
ncbi:hypothetical protein QYG89_15480 [Bacillus sp. B190/17]|uniref:Uncharacterized protein n=1 Tax=Bacillus lumedeiriae TaxID=3058829 RepID=A0ABW8IC16_9BACI